MFYVTSNGKGWPDQAVGTTLMGDGKVGWSKDAWVVDLGYVKRYRLWVDPGQDKSSATHNILTLDEYSVDSVGHWVMKRTPLIANVQDFIAYYGVDDGQAKDDSSGGAPAPDDNIVDHWVDAYDLNWGAAKVKDGSGTLLKQIKAIRIGLVVRNDNPDKLTKKTLTNGEQYQDFHLFQYGGNVVCGDNSDGRECVVNVRCPLVDSSKDSSTAYRCRKYETVIPLRNSIWNWNNAA
jgi:hypothetical protein